jgi:hypothetical protein
LQRFDDLMSHFISRAKKADAFLILSRHAKLLILLFQLSDPLLLRSQRVADTWLTILLGSDLRQPPPDCCLANVHAFADVANTLALLSDHPNHFQLQVWIECFAFSCRHVLPSGGAFSTY